MATREKKPSTSSQWSFSTRRNTDPDVPLPKAAPDDNAAGKATAAASQLMGVAEADMAFYNAFPEQRRLRMRTKVDVRLLPVLSILYLLAHLDRTNIGNAKIEGLKEDTHLTDRQYNVVLAVFFIPYTLLEIPSNMVLRGLKRPSNHVGFIVLAWGIVMTCHGFAQNYGGLLVLRLLLGAFEAGFQPAAMYLCSQWYRPHELAFRFSVFMALSPVAGIVSGFLAAAIARMDGLGGYQGWRWIFLVEGLATVVLGVVSWFMLPDTPRRSARWLAPDEIRHLEIQALVREGSRVAEKAGQEPASVWRDLGSILTSLQCWAFGYLFITAATCSYGLKFAIPTIIKGVGYTRTQAQLLSTVPYIFAVFSGVMAAFGSDKLKRRCIVSSCGFVSIIIGFAIILGLLPDRKHHGASLIAGLTLVMGGVAPLPPTNGSWAANNIVSPGRRAVGLGFVMSFGALGGLVGSLIYLESQAPQYPLGYGISAALAASGLLVALALEALYWYRNWKRSRMTEAGIREAYSEDDLRRMGEDSPLFRYTL